jgi:large repetitive protein
MATSDLSTATASVGLVTTSYALTPQATEDCFTVSEDGTVQLFDVMANDLGGKAKTLYSIDGVEDGIGLADILYKDASQTVDLSTTSLESIVFSERSKFGAGIAIVNGKVLYNTTTAEFQSAFNHLAAGEIAYDTINYAIRLSNGTLSTSAVTIKVVGANDDATITGDISGGVVEDTTPTASGDLNVIDPDAGQDEVQPIAAGTTGDNGYGTFEVAANGNWTYTLNNSLAAVQALPAGATLTDTITVTSEDGTDTQIITITITGTNGAATITGDVSGGVVEDATLTVSGDLDVSDEDSGEDEVQPIAAGTAGDNGYGTFEVAANGNWTYTLNNSLAAVQALPAGATLTDTITVLSEDGTDSQVITITITGTNGDATITGDVSGGVVEDSTLTVSGDLNVTDEDAGEDEVQPIAAGTAGDNGYGTFEVAANGNWTYTLDNSLAAVQSLPAGATLADTITVLSEDGTDSQVITITITGTNGDATITGDVSGGVVEDSTLTVSGDLDVSDEDSGEDEVQPVAAGTAGDNAYGTFEVLANGNWTYTLDNSLAAVQSLPAGATLTDTITVTSEDGTDTQIITITITGTNGPATITGDVSGGVVEDATLTVSGDLDVSDEDSGEDEVQPIAAGTAGDNAYGTFEVAANGNWTYTLDNSVAAVQALPAGVTLTDAITVLSEDGTDTQVITVTITGTNGVATITGDVSGGVVEDTTLTVSGDLDVTDEDTGEDEVQPIAAGTAGDNGYGTFEVAANGNWTYTLDNSVAAVQALPAGATLTDTITVLSEDGTDSQVITITITGTNGTATITGDVSGDVVEDTTLTASGDLAVSDEDSGEDEVQPIAAGTAGDNAYGTFEVLANGNWTYTLDNSLAAVQSLPTGATLTDTITVLSEDGTDSQVITVTITGTNGVATITGDVSGGVIEDTTLTVSGDLDVTDEDSGEDEVQPIAAGTAGDNGYGTFEVAANGNWTYTLNNALPAVQALTAGATLTDTITVLSEDGTDSQVITVTITGTADNLPPTAVGDKWIVSIGTAVTLPPLAVLANDNDPNGDTLAILSVSSAVNITSLVLNADGSVSFTAGAAVGSGSFQYTVTDGHGGTATATVNIDFIDASGGYSLAASTYDASYLDAGNGTDSVTGGSGVVDHLLGGNGTDTLTGNANQDILRGGAGSDTIDGGAGTTDLIDFSDGSSGITFTLVQSASTTSANVTGAGLGTDTYSNIEGVIGTQSGDTLTGSALADIIDGNGGNDTIAGGLGGDTIIGGIGADVLRGGTVATPDDGASDRFVYRDASQGGDTIIGFNVGTPLSGGDVLDFTQIFDLNPSATVLFASNGGNAQVLVDLDGNAGTVGDQVAMATLSGVAYSATIGADLADNIVV